MKPYIVRFYAVQWLAFLTRINCLTLRHPWPLICHFQMNILGPVHLSNRSKVNFVLKDCGPEWSTL